MRALLNKIVFGFLSLCLTVIVFSNSIELLANKQMPLGFSLQKMEIQAPINKTIQDFSIKRNSQFFNSNSKLGSLDILEIPSLRLVLQLEEAREVDGNWFQRPSLGQYMALNKDDLGNPVDYLIYTSKSWRSVPYTEEIEVGDMISILTKEGREISFEVASRDILSLDSSLIVSKSEKRQIVLMIEDSENSRYYGYSLVLR